MSTYVLRFYRRRPEGELHDLSREIAIDAETDSEAISSGAKCVQSLASPEDAPGMAILIGPDDRRCWSLVAPRD